MRAQAGLWGEVHEGRSEGKVVKERRWRAVSSLLLSSLIQRGTTEKGTFPVHVSLPALAMLSFGSMLTIQRSHLPPCVPASPWSTRCHRLPCSWPRLLFALPESEQNLASLLMTCTGCFWGSPSLSGGCI